MRLILAMAVWFAGLTTAFAETQDHWDFPMIPGAAEEFHAAAKDGDATAAYNYILPLITGMSLDQGTKRQIIGYLEFASRSYDLQGRDGPLYAVEAARLLTVMLQSLNEHADALSWARRCVRLLSGALADPDSNMTIAFCLEAAAVSMNELSQYREAIR